MSIGISSFRINNSVNSVQNPGRVAFKSNNPSQDKVEISQKKKELSTAAKIGIGLGVISTIAFGVELIACKGKHIKNLWERISNGKGSKKSEGTNKLSKQTETPNKQKSEGVSEGVKSSTSEVTTQIADFKNIDEAKTWFENFGIHTEFKDISNSDLVYMNKIAKDFKELEQLGVAVSKPESLVISDWTKVDELSRLYTERNIIHDIETLRERSGYWGRAQVGTDGKIHVFLNSNNLSTVANQNILQHEIGHHCRILEDSVLAKKINNLEDLGSKKLEILGYRTDLPHKNVFNDLEHECWGTVNGPEFLCSFDDNGVVRLNTECISGKKITDLFKREVGKSYGYKDYQADEFVADIFRGLTTGHEYSDEVMLAYDFIGGGRVPNLVIKGKSYDDYIMSLYDNHELVQKLKDMTQLKKVIGVENGNAILQDLSKEASALLMKN